MAGAHSRFAPSAMHRIIPCPASLTYAERYPDASSKYADEGTTAHWVATQLAAGALDAKSGAKLIGTQPPKEVESTVPIDRDMLYFGQEFANLCASYVAQGGELFLENKVDFSTYIGVDGQLGTADAIIVFPDRLVVIDYKYGIGVKVYAEDNEQMQCYALGAVDMFAGIADFESVTMVIHQPRVGNGHPDEASIDMESLMAFGKRINDVAVEALGPDPKFGPGDKQCKFCPAQGDCPARREQLSAILKADFAAFDDDESGGFSAEELGHLLDISAQAESFIKAVRAEAERRLFANKPVIGADGPYKIVEGKLGDRQWIDKDEVDKAMKALKLGTAVRMKTEIISPPEAERRLKQTNPDAWEKLQKHITRKPGKPSVAPATDKRPTVPVGATASDFAGLDEKD